MSITHRIRDCRVLLGCHILTLCCVGASTEETPEAFGFGRSATKAELAVVDSDVRYDGLGLPEGSGTYEQGMAVYKDQCESCHGTNLQGNPEVAGNPLVGPGKTIEKYWPYAPTLFDYIRRSMPLYAPRSLSDTEVYGLVAFILGKAGVISKQRVLDARALAEVRMPNQDGFVPDPRPDVE